MTLLPAVESTLAIHSMKWQKRHTKQRHRIRLTLFRNSGLDDRGHETFGYFWLKNEDNEIGWWLPMSLDKVEKEKDELGDSTSQLRCHTHEKPDKDPT